MVPVPVSHFAVKVAKNSVSHFVSLFQIIHCFVSGHGQTESSCTTQWTCLDEHEGTALISSYTRIVVTVQTWEFHTYYLNFLTCHCWVSLGWQKNIFKLIFTVVDTHGKHCKWRFPFLFLRMFQLPLCSMQKHRNSYFFKLYLGFYI